MNKLVHICLGVMVMFSASLADFVRTEAGIGLWSNESSGKTTYTTALATAADSSTQKSNTDSYVWIYIKHPTFIIPNLRLEYTNITSDGIANGTFKNFTAVSSPTSLELKQYDVVAYYNILDNTGWMTLDLGLDIKVLDGSYSAQNVTPTSGIGTTYSDSEMIPLPMAYVRLRFEIPSTDVALEGDVKYVKYSSSSVYDARMKIDYTLDIMPAIDPALEVGYRVQSYEIDEEALSGKIDLEFSGFYAGLMMRF